LSEQQVFNRTQRGTGPGNVGDRVTDDLIRDVLSGRFAPPYFLEELAAAAEDQGFRATVNRNRLYILTPYNPSFTEAMKRTAFTRWVRGLGWEIVPAPVVLDQVASIADSVYGTSLAPVWRAVVERQDGAVRQTLATADVVLLSDYAVYVNGEELVVARPGIYYDGSDTYMFFVELGARAIRDFLFGVRYHLQLPARKPARRRLAEKVVQHVMQGSHVLGAGVADLAYVNGMLYSDFLEFASAAPAPPGPVPDPSPPGKRLYPFQLASLYFMEELMEGRGVIVGDEMGLGKTVQALAYARLHPELRPILIVVPSSLRANWEREAREWLPEEADHIQTVYSGKDQIHADASIVIVSYDLFAKDPDKYVAIHPRLVVFDESHYIKNERAKRTKAAINLSEQLSGSTFILLSGTPIVNSATDIFPQLLVVGALTKRDKKWFYSTFAKEETVQTSRGLIVVYRGFRNVNELYRFLRRSGVLIRRRKSQVLGQLPDKRRYPLLVNVDRGKYAEEVRRKLREFLERHKDRLDAVRPAMLLAEMNFSRQVAARLKAGAAGEIVANMAMSEGKVVVFTYHREPAKLLAENVAKHLGEEYSRYYVDHITGETPAPRRQQIVDAFSRAERAILYVNIRAGGVGLNLQSARVGVFFELDWTPAAIKQAEDRLHRIGQESDVDIYFIIAQGTIEESMYRLVAYKDEAIQASLDPDTVREIFLEELGRVGLDANEFLAKVKGRARKTEKRREGRRARRRSNT